MPVEVGARGFVGSSVYDLLTKLSICDNKRTKASKLLAEMAENICGWIWSMRCSFIRIKNALTIARPVGEWYSAWISSPSRDEGVGSGSKRLLQGGFLSEEYLLSSPPMSFYLLKLIHCFFSVYQRFGILNHWEITHFSFTIFFFEKFQF